MNCVETQFAPCCGNDDNIVEMTPILGDTKEPSNWTCNNQYNEDLCPDIFGGLRYFNFKTEISWFYDMDQDTVISQCGCKYSLNGCQFPPTKSPTTLPTDDTASPTINPSMYNI